jgi:cytochrome c oxidase subunit 2
MAEIGEKVFAQKCTACHNATTEKKVGPGLAAIFGKSHQFEDGSEQAVDENYLRESILNPAAKIVKGYPNAMTPFQGQIAEEELAGVIEYLKGLK